MTNELEQLYSSKAAILTEQEDRLRKFQESVVSTVQSVLSSIHSSNDAELLVSRSALEATLRDTEKHTMLLEPEVDFAAKLVCDRKALQKLMDAVLNKKSYRHRKLYLRRKHKCALGRVRYNISRIAEFLFYHCS